MKPAILHIARLTTTTSKQQKKNICEAVRLMLKYISFRQVFPLIRGVGKSELSLNFCARRSSFSSSNLSGQVAADRARFFTPSGRSILTGLYDFEISPFAGPKLVVLPSTSNLFSQILLGDNISIFGFR